MATRDWFSTLSGGQSRLADATGAIPDREFNSKTLAMARLLATRFPDPRSRIGLWGENSLDYLVALLAVLRAGHVAVPLSTRFGARELADIVKAAKLQGMLVAPHFPEGYRPALESLPVYALAPRSGDEYVADKVRLKELGEREIAVLMCSSGSTGTVKIVPHSLSALFAHAEAVCKHLNVTWHDSWIACLPFYHIGGLAILFRSLVSGASLQIAPTADPDEINRLIDVEQASLVSVVATTLERVLSRRANRPFPRTLRAIIVGGGPVPAPLLARCPEAIPTYGLTEMGSMVTCARIGAADAERLSAGLPLPGTEVRILDDKGKAVKTGTSGQIVCRGPGMAESYLDSPEATARTFKGGWVYTGDIGQFDAEGRLHVQARREDLVLSGGENIYPAEIEAALREHPRVQQVVVLPVEDAEWGQTPGAYIVLSPGRPLEKVHIYLHLEARLARFKFPRRIVFAESLPTLPTGKPDLKAIRQALLAAK